MSASSPSAGAVTVAVLVCSTCEAFICDSSRILPHALPSSQLSSQVFAYELEDVFPQAGGDSNNTSGVWCYVCSEEIRTVVSIPPEWAPVAADALLRDVRSSGAEGRLPAPAASVSTAAVRLEARDETSRRFDVLRISAKDVVGATVNLVFSSHEIGSGGGASVHRSGVRSEDGVEDPSRVEQSRSSDWESWFTDFPSRTCVSCQCCGTVFGWLFQSRSGALTGSSSSSSTPSRHDRAHGDDIFSPSDVAHDNEEGGDAHSDSERRLRQFVGLQLRRVKLRQWSPAELVVADRRARQSGHRFPTALVPRTGSSQSASVTDADELQLRLQALRNQVSLYVDLLAKHREQSDVARQLLQSQRLQVRQNEDKVSTMEQIIEAHRKQLEVQQRHMRHQDELLQNQREQIVTQQRQIDVEQLLLHEQNRTIQSQLDQMRLLHATLRAKELSRKVERDAASSNVGDGTAQTAAAPSAHPLESTGDVLPGDDD